MFIYELVSLTTLGWLGSGVVCNTAFRALRNTCGPVFSAIALILSRGSKCPQLCRGSVPYPLCRSLLHAALLRERLRRSVSLARSLFHVSALGCSFRVRNVSGGTLDFAPYCARVRLACLCVPCPGLTRGQRGVARARRRVEACGPEEPEDGSPTGGLPPLRADG